MGHHGTVLSSRVLASSITSFIAEVASSITCDISGLIAGGGVASY